MMPGIAKPPDAMPYYIWRDETAARPEQQKETGPWASVPLHRRSIARAYINSENESDRERAYAICKQYDLDYDAMRKVVMDKMIEESRELGKSWTPAAGSRPLSPWPSIDRADDAQEEAK